MSININGGNWDLGTILSAHKNKNTSLEQRQQINNLRKENPELDRMMYASDLADLHKEIAKTNEIAKKIAKGEQITEEEKNYIQDKNPQLLQEAQTAKQEAEDLRDKLKNTNNPEEAALIIANSMTSVKNTAKYNPVKADLMMEAFQATINSYNANLNKDDDDDKKAKTTNFLNIKNLAKLK